MDIIHCKNHLMTAMRTLIKIKREDRWKKLLSFAGQKGILELF